MTESGGHSDEATLVNQVDAHPDVHRVTEPDEEAVLAELYGEADSEGVFPRAGADLMGTAAGMLAEARTSLGTAGRPNPITRDYASRHGKGFLRAPWCDMAITYWARRSGNVAKVLPGGDRAYTVWHAQDFRKAGRWHIGTAAEINRARPGDIVFFDWGRSDNIGAIDHVGVVEKVLGGGRVQTIEGNTGDACKRRVRVAADIAGYGRPAYSGTAPKASTSVFGVDYAWGRPGPAALKAVGAKFVCRYVSHDTTGKNLTRDEAEQLSAAGLWLVVVWETTASRALSGHAGGRSDAQTAWTQARACGMPDDRPIYFAVDFDAVPAQQNAINAYLDGAASVIGRERVGIYGGYGPVKRAVDAEKARWAWQTYAWSGSRWDPRAHIQQYSNDHTLNGVSVDYDRAVKDDYGQWRVGVSPQEDDMEPTTTVKVPPYWVGKHLGHPSYSAASLWAGSLSETRAYGKAILAKLDAQAATIDKLVDALPAAQPDLDALKAEIREAIESVTVSILTEEHDEDQEERPA